VLSIRRGKAKSLDTPFCFVSPKELTVSVISRAVKEVAGEHEEQRMWNAYNDLFHVRSSKRE
jgi:hypothetical protein